jgi:methionyl-tRNA formyltransferase
MATTYRIVFMGTPQFALPTLQLLIDEYPPQKTHPHPPVLPNQSSGQAPNRSSGQAPNRSSGQAPNRSSGQAETSWGETMSGEVVGVVTQPDRPSGRGRQLQPPPVKILAQKYGIPVLQPASLRSPEALAELQTLQPEVIVVAAFGQILPTTVLDLPPFGCINVHASLLPRWRGAAPVAAAILAGDDTTGVTIMKMDAGLDTGPILSQRPLAVAPDDTRESLSARLAQLGADLLHDTLPAWLAGNIEPQLQDESRVTHAPQIKKEQGRINWSEPADDIARKVRAFYPWPGAFTYWQGKPLKILRAAADPEYWQDEDSPSQVHRADQGSALPPGTVTTGPSGLAVMTGHGMLKLYQVQPAGKRPMPADDFARGARGFVGTRLT